MDERKALSVLFFVGLTLVSGLVEFLRISQRLEVCALSVNLARGVMMLFFGGCETGPSQDRMYEYRLCSILTVSRRYSHINISEVSVRLELKNFPKLL